MRVDVFLPVECPAPGGSVARAGSRRRLAGPRVLVLATRAPAAGGPGGCAASERASIRAVSPPRCRSPPALEGGRKDVVRGQERHGLWRRDRGRERPQEHAPIVVDLP